MRARSWMAALALIGATSILIGRGLSGPVARAGAGADPVERGEETAGKAPAGSPKDGPKSGSQPEKRRFSGTHFPTIQLDLAVAGLGAEGCDVEVKPANAGSKFRPSPTEHVSSDGRATIKLRDVELAAPTRPAPWRSPSASPASRPRRSIAASGPAHRSPGTVPRFACFISSQVAGADAKTTRK